MKKTDELNSIEDENGEKYFEIIRKKTLWEEYIYNIEKQISKVKIRSKMKTLGSSIKVQIPSKNNVRYTYIRNIEDYNLSNSLVFDMIIRNQEFQNYMYNVAIIDFEFEHKSPVLKAGYYKKLKHELIEKFGFNIKDEQKILFHPYINEVIADNHEKILDFFHNPKMD